MGTRVRRALADLEAVLEPADREVEAVEGAHGPDEGGDHDSHHHQGDKEKSQSPDPHVSTYHATPTPDGPCLDGMRLVS